MVCKIQGKKEGRKMIPKTQLRYSRIYNHLFDEKFSKKDFVKLKKDSLKFAKLYEKNISEMLRLIEEHHSKQWKYKFIPIYLVSNASASFSDPLTITFKYNRNEKYLLIVLAHELLHNNMGKKKFKNPKELHIYMEPILNKIILGISIDLKEDLGFFNKIIKKTYKIK